MSGELDAWFEVHGAVGLAFENSPVGLLKKQVWEASEEEIDAILTEYGIPSPPELGLEGSYIQNTVRHQLQRNRSLNDLVFIPIGSCENHGPHTVSAFDTLLVTSLLEGVRRYDLKRGRPVNLALPPFNYGSHPHHHLGMPGTVVIRPNVFKEFLKDVMFGLWNDGFRKQILVNNHGHFWLVKAAVQEFCLENQLPGIFRALDWHCAVREFFRTKDRGGPFDTDFVHADEAETSLGLLLFPQLVDMAQAVDTEPELYLPAYHLDKAVGNLGRPSEWSDGQGHMALEIHATPEGIVGKATLADARKAKRAIAAILRYLTLLQDEILERYPAGQLPPVDKITLRTKEELAPFLKEPGSDGWRTAYALPKLGIF
ncbi:MAG: 3-dehydro-scyllo-inosose hydrolase [Chloroflexota bacterium]|nr:3-dehydro-scyllo-inosose hydrolase [Chloroflexota bacterium]